MNRLTKAWKALRGTLEPEVRETEVNVEEVTLYKIDCESYAISLMFTGNNERLYGRHYLSCQEAFAAIGGADYLHVETVDAIKVGSRYFPKNSCIKVGPKPKRPKGRA